MVGSFVSSCLFLLVFLSNARGDLGEALEAPELTWVTTGDAPWTVQNNYDRNGYWSPMAQSGAIGNGQSSMVSVEVTGPGRLTFWWKVSSQPILDYLSWALNDVEQARISGPSTPGSSGWLKQTVYVGAGTQKLHWTYAKGATGSGGQDAGWLDHASYTPGTFPPVITAGPASQNIAAGFTASFSVQADGAPPFSYQWQHNGKDLPGATDSVLTIAECQPENNGDYRVVVSNTYGSTTSTNATLNAFFFVGPQQARDALDRWYFRGSAPLTRVKFVNGLFFGLGDRGALMTSPDGAVWTRRNSGTTADLRGVAYGSVVSTTTPRLFVVVGTGGTILTSSDAVTWVPATIANQDLNDVAWAPTMFPGGFVAMATANPEGCIAGERAPERWEKGC